MVIIKEIKPAVLMKRIDGILLQKAVAEFDGAVPPGEYVLIAQVSDIKWLNKIDSGNNKCDIWVPDVTSCCTMEFILYHNGSEVCRKEIQWEPQRRWEVCFVPVTHHDYGYTHAIDDLLIEYDRYYDSILDFCDATVNYPFESQYRYTVETVWSLCHYLENCPEDRRRRLIKYAQEGRIEVSALLCNVIDSICSYEELHRTLYHSARLKKYGIPVETASIVDIPGLSWGTVQVLANAGIKYLFAGFPTYFEWYGENLPSFWDEAKILRYGRPDAFYLQGPDQSRILAYYQASYGWLAGPTTTTITGPHCFQEVEDNLPYVLSEIEDSGSPLSVCRFIDHCLDNFPPSGRISEIVREWNEKYEYPRLIVATNSMFFKKLEYKCGELRTFSGEIPHTDYNVAVHSAACLNAMNRNTHDLLSMAESLCILDKILTGAEYPSGELEKACYDTIMFDEHCYGMSRNHGIWQDYNWSLRRVHAYRAAFLARKALRRAMEHISMSVNSDSSSKTITVFNALPYTRSGIVRVSDISLELDKNIAVIDCITGKEEECQTDRITAYDQALPYASSRYSLGLHYNEDIVELLFTAHDVPGLGYRTYRLDYRDCGASVDFPVKRNDEFEIENEYYRISSDFQSGLIKSVFDKSLNKELIDTSGEGFCMPVLYNIEKNEIEKPLLKYIETESGKLEKVLRIRSSLSGCPEIVQEIRIYSEIKQITVSNRILKNSAPHQVLYFAFPFNITSPEFSFDGTTSTVRPFKDQLPGSNTHYYSMQRWAQVQGETTAAVISSQDTSIVQFGELWPLRVSQAHHCRMPAGFKEDWRDPGTITRGHIYSLALISNFRTNFAAEQSGDMLFRYTITSSQKGYEDTYRFGKECTSPLMAFAPGKYKPGALSQSNSLINLDQSNVVLETIKNADDNKGIILRLRETQGMNGELELHIPMLIIKEVYITDGVEKNQMFLPVNNSKFILKLMPWQTKTIRVVPSGDYHLPPAYDWSSLY